MRIFLSLLHRMQGYISFLTGCLKPTKCGNQERSTCSLSFTVKRRTGQPHNPGWAVSWRTSLHSWIFWAAWSKLVFLHSKIMPYYRGGLLNGGKVQASKWRDVMFKNSSIFEQSGEMPYKFSPWNHFLWGKSLRCCPKLNSQWHLINATI